MSLLLTGAGKMAAAGGGGGAIGAGYSTEAAQYLNRLSADPGTTWKDKVAALIDGIVADGVANSSNDWTNLKAMWLVRTNALSEADQQINIKSSSFGLTKHGSLAGSFSNNTGITFNASTGYYSTGLVPSAVLSSQNTGTVWCNITNSRTTGQAWTAVCSCDGTNTIFLHPLDVSGGGTFFASMNDVDFQSFANANAQGRWAIVRASSVQIWIEKNNARQAGLGPTAIARPPVEILLGAFQNNGGTPSNFSGDTFTDFGVAEYTEAEANRVGTRIDTFLAAI